MTKLKLKESAETEQQAEAAEVGSFRLEQGLLQQYPGSAAGCGARYSSWGIGDARAALADPELLSDLHRGVRLGDVIAISVFRDAGSKSRHRLSALLELMVVGLRPASPDHGPGVAYKLIARHDFDGGAA